MSNKKVLDKLKTGDKLYITKQERILNKFNDQQMRQTRMIEVSCNGAKKKYEDSCLLRDGYTRKKQEVKEILDLVKTDFEKYGSQNFWVNCLRKDKEDRVLNIEAI